MISSGSSPVRFSTGSRFSASSTASPDSYTLSPNGPESLMPLVLPAERRDAPTSGPRPARFEDDEPRTGVERVGRAGHRLDRDSGGARDELVHCEHLEEAVRLVEPQPCAAGSGAQFSGAAGQAGEAGVHPQRAKSAAAAQVVVGTRHGARAHRHLLLVDDELFA